MTDDEKEMVATIKLSLLRAIVDLNEETIAMAIKAPKSEEPSEDCVSRQAVLESINDWWGITATSREPTLCDCIRELPPVAPTQKWIPVSERLPEEDGFYLATLDGEICGEDEPISGMAEFENGKWVDDEDDYQCVLAWMPLPEPYLEI